MINKTIAQCSTFLVCGWLLSACGPTSYVVLLENDNGTTGAIEVKGKAGTQVVDKADAGVELDGAKQAFQLTQSEIQEEFAATLAARPMNPSNFILKFEKGGAQLTSESEALLPGIVEEIGKHPGADISIIGHTDTAGDAAKNIALGLVRAQFVANKLNERNIKVAGNTVTSHGESNPIKKTPDDTDEAENRRVEISVR